MHLPSRYVVGRELGRGGMGIVYEADDNRLGRKVAIKVLHTGPEHPGKHRFAREARAASALNHPNIITIHDIDAADDGDFIVMELVEGVPLSRLSRDGPMAVERAIDYSLQIAAALAASHSADIVHRDLKPANVMVTTEGLISISDRSRRDNHQRRLFGNRRHPRERRAETVQRDLERRLLTAIGSVRLHGQSRQERRGLRVL